MTMARLKRVNKEAQSRDIHYVMDTPSPYVMWQLSADLNRAGSGDKSQKSDSRPDSQLLEHEGSCK